MERVIDGFIAGTAAGSFLEDDVVLVDDRDFLRRVSGCFVENKLLLQLQYPFFFVSTPVFGYLPPQAV